MANQNKTIGNIQPNCPYCGEQLAKMPSRKSKCPKCENYFYVRTRPIDKQRVVVTSSQADQIDEEWAKNNGTYEQLIEGRKVFDEEKARLTEKYHEEASDNNVQWSLLNKQGMVDAREGNWGLYRNTRFEMAEILKKEGRLKGALSKYLEVCYLDLNGPNNTSSGQDSEYPPFSPSEARLALGIITRALKIIKKLGLGEDETKQIFYQIASINYSSLKLPVTPDIAWERLRPELIV